MAKPKQSTSKPSKSAPAMKPPCAPKDPKHAKLKAANASKIISNSKSKQLSDGSSDETSDNKQGANKSKNKKKGRTSKKPDESDDEDESEGEDKDENEKNKVQAYLSPCGKMAMVPDGNGNIVSFDVIPQPKSCTIKLKEDMKLNGSARDEQLFLTIRDYICTLTRAKVEDIETTWSEVSAEVIAHVCYKARKKHGYLLRFKGNWATEAASQLSEAPGAPAEPSLPPALPKKKAGGATKWRESVKAKQNARKGKAVNEDNERNVENVDADGEGDGLASTASNSDRPSNSSAKRTGTTDSDGKAKGKNKRHQSPSPSESRSDDEGADASSAEANHKAKRVQIETEKRVGGSASNSENKGEDQRKDKTPQHRQSPSPGQHSNKGTSGKAAKRTREETEDEGESKGESKGESEDEDEGEGEGGGNSKGAGKDKSNDNSAGITKSHEVERNPNASTAQKSTNKPTIDEEDGSEDEDELMTQFKHWFNEQRKLKGKNKGINKKPKSNPPVDQGYNSKSKASAAPTPASKAPITINSLLTAEPKATVADVFSDEDAASDIREKHTAKAGKSVKDTRPTHELTPRTVNMADKPDEETAASTKPSNHSLKAQLPPPRPSSPDSTLTTSSGPTPSLDNLSSEPGEARQSTTKQTVRPRMQPVPAATKPVVVTAEPVDPESESEPEPKSSDMSNVKSSVKSRVLKQELIDDHDGDQTYV